MRADGEDAMAGHNAVPDWAGLMPAGVAALGPATQPCERMMRTQAAVYRFIVLLGELRLSRPRVPRRAPAPGTFSTSA